MRLPMFGSLSPTSSPSAATAATPRDLAVESVSERLRGAFVARGGDTGHGGEPGHTPGARSAGDQGDRYNGFDGVGHAGETAQRPRQERAHFFTYRTLPSTCR
jgi:hypothetical protein